MASSRVLSLASYTVVVLQQGLKAAAGLSEARAYCRKNVVCELLKCWSASLDAICTKKSVLKTRANHQKT